MISNKTLTTIFLITLKMQCAASSNTQEPGPSNKSTPLIRKRRPALKPKEVLMDTTNKMNPVGIPKESTGEVDTSQEQPAPQRKSGPGFFEILMSRGRYDRVCYFAKRIGNDKFLKHIYHLVKTLGQYNGIVGYLKRHNLVASFYVYGDIEVVRGVIFAESKVYDDNDYAKDGDLEAALPLALENDNHDRFIKILDIRKGITAEKDEQPKQQGELMTSFGSFVVEFIENLAPWENGMALRRFLILHGDELRSKRHDILDILCETLVCFLVDKFDLPEVESFLVDLVGRPSLLTPLAFAIEFLADDIDENRSNFIKLGYREAIEEGLKKENRGGGKKLWRAMQTGQPDQFPGKFPATEEARTAACMHITTKREKEEQWIKKNVAILCSKIKSESISSILPDVLWSIIFEYAVLLVVTWNLTTSTE